MNNFLQFYLFSRLIFLLQPLFVLLVVSCQKAFCSSLLICIIDNLHKQTALKRQFIVCQIFSTDVRWSASEINLLDKLPGSHIKNT